MAQSRQPRELDNLPAFGLREDAFDDELRAATRKRSRRPRYHEDEDDDEDDEWSPRPHLVEDPADPAVWLARERVSQTEVSLQLGRHLLQSSLATSNVVTLAGYERFNSANIALLRHGSSLNATNSHAHRSQIVHCAIKS